MLLYPLAFSTPVTRKGTWLKRTSYGVFSVGEKIILYRLADDTYFGGSLYVGFCKHRAVLHRKLADFKVVRAYAAYGRGVVVIACNELSR